MTEDDLVRRTHELLERVPPSTVDQVTFRSAQYAAGLAMIHFPEGKGGLGRSRSSQVTVNGVLRDAGVAYDDMVVNPIGIGMGAPTVLAYGNEELHDRHLRRIFTGEDIWCQLFSEPSHGSDVAGIASTAVRDGDEWVVNGQKVWTTLAHCASFGMLLTRTDRSAPKHRGLSYFVLDMRAPGVDVRPLFQMTGEAEFNEVFLTDVRVPHTNMLGAEGDGWAVATTTLMNERVALGGVSKGKGGGPIRHLADIWSKVADDLEPGRRAVLRDEVTKLWIRAEVLRLTGQRVKAARGSAGPEGSIGKLMAAELNQAISEMAVEVQGAEGMLHRPGYPMERAGEAAIATLSGRFLRSPANTIEGGTSEIMRNILGERVLGLPREPGFDKDLPWDKIPR